MERHLPGAEEQPPLDLSSSKQAGENSPVLLLRWCLSEEARDYLARRNVEEVLLFVSITDPNGKERRLVIDPWKPQEYIEFYRPGIHHLSAMLVWEQKERFFSFLRYAQRDFLKQEVRGVYEYDLPHVLRKHEDAWCDWFPQEAHLDIPVSGGFFANSPPAWEQWWLELFWGEMWDECSVRRRRLFAYTIQPAIVLAALAILLPVRFTIAFFYSGILARRGVDWGAVVNIFGKSIQDVSRGVDERYGSLLKEDKNGNTRRGAKVLVLFVPLTQVCILVLAEMLRLVLAAILPPLLSWAGFALVYIGLLLLLSIWFFIQNTPFKNVVRQQENRRQKARMERYAKLVCANGSGYRNPASVTARVTLLFHEVKAAFCRPIAR